MVVVKTVNCHIDHRFGLACPLARHVREGILGQRIKLDAPRNRQAVVDEVGAASEQSPRWSARERQSWRRMRRWLGNGGFTVSGGRAHALGLSLLFELRARVEAFGVLAHSLARGGSRDDHVLCSCENDADRK